MNWVLKYRTVRIPCSAANPATEPPACTEPAERVPSAAEVEPSCGRERSKSPQAKSRVQPREPKGLALAVPSQAEETAAERSAPEGPPPHPGALARRSARPELAERARPPRPACPEPGRRGRHARICSVCNHPDRDAIEEAFIHWHSPSDIACDYNLPDRSSVYRHAHATGLFALRRRNLRFVLENLLEDVDRVKVTAGSIVRAVRAYTRINDAGEWIEPPTRIIVSSGSPPQLARLFTLSVANVPRQP